MTTRVVVADEHEARFYDAENARDPLQLAASLEDATARLHDRDLDSDRPGRTFDRMGGGRHAMDGERSSRGQQRARFARRIAAALETGRSTHQFDRLVLIAGPRMLGLIRPSLSESCRSITAAEVAKDLTGRDATEIRNYVPSRALAGRPRPVNPLHSRHNS